MSHNADLLWWVEAHDSHDALVAVLPAFAPDVPEDARVVTNLPDESGKMMVWANQSGCWTQLRAEEPRRG